MMIPPERTPPQVPALPLPEGHLVHHHHDGRECFQGSTEFYDTPDIDEFTPSYLEAGLLPESVYRRSDGTIPPWFDPTSPDTAMKQYVDWFNGIWHTGDPSGWNYTIFTNQAVMIDPTGMSKGAKQAAELFTLLFKYFPELRGEVVSWAANEREIMINWRFRIMPEGSKTPVLVAVLDKFCFVDGFVSFRLAYFDILTLISYLSRYYGYSQLWDFLSASFWNSEKTGGIQSLPSIIVNLIKGMFLWTPQPDSLGLQVYPQEGAVSLTWNPVEKAVGYNVLRATGYSGPYDVVKQSVEAAHFIDDTVVNGVAYWYIVTPVFPKWKVPPRPQIPFVEYRHGDRAQVHIGAL